tara:strand:+ start:613 stop:813 length:201 start_codon:yes stop_codon:yes gene_type:complete
MNDDDLQIKKRVFANQLTKYYIYNNTTNDSASKDYENKADVYKILADLKYPVLKKPVIKKQTCHLF